MNTYIYKFLSAILVIVFIQCGIDKSFAQQDLTIHHIQSIPQHNYTNPAFKPECNMHIGLPVLSSLYFGLGNSALDYRDILYIREDDSVATDFEKFIDRLKKTNYLSLNMQEEILSFGLKKGKYYFNLSVTEKIDFKFNYPKDFMTFLYEGNGSEKFLGKEASFDGIGANVTHYREFALGAARELNSKWSVGAKVKFLFGKANVNAKKTNLSFYTDNDMFDLTAKSDILINTSLPAAWTDDDSGEFDVGNYILNGKNKGLGLDLGGTYKLDDKFSFAASVIDLGFIRWKTDVKNFVSENAAFTFQGIEMYLNEFYKESNTDSIVEHKLDNLLDSIGEEFEFTETNNKYTTYLSPKIYLSGTYKLSDKERIGAIIRNEIFLKKIRPALAVSYNRKFGNILSASASYSIRNRSYMNLGLAFALNLGPVQLYMAADNVYGMIFYDKVIWSDGSMMYPKRPQNLNFHFGINLIFGYKDKGGTAPLIDLGGDDINKEE